MAGTSATVDVVLLIVAVGLAAIAWLGVHLGRAVAPRRPSLPVEDQPPAGLTRLVPVGRQVEHEVRRGVAALEHFLIAHRRRANAEEAG